MSEQQLAINPFARSEPSRAAAPAVVQVEQERAVQEVQAAIAIAKRFPRDTRASMDRILTACTRPTLAEGAMYAYPRGSEVVTGPSIRLAEALAQQWGNMQFGIRELSQSNGESTVESFAWDVETNTRQTKIFTVPHLRHTRNGQRKLTDPRDIYELVANQGARRLRACILGVIPGDVVDAAVQQCELTLANKGGAPSEQIKEMVKSFERFGVTPEHIAKRLGHNLDSVIAAEILQLRKIFASLRDGMAKPADFFDVAEAAPQQDESTAALNSALANKRKASLPKAKEERVTDVDPATGEWIADYDGATEEPPK